MRPPRWSCLSTALLSVAIVILAELNGAEPEPSETDRTTGSSGEVVVELIARWRQALINREFEKMQDLGTQIEALKVDATPSLVSLLVFENRKKVPDSIMVHGAFAGYVPLDRVLHQPYPQLKHIWTPRTSL